MKVKTIEFVRSAPNWAALPRDGKAEIAFVGRSNVGKSSLMNALVGRKNLARTSSTPGKTQTLNYYLVNGPAGFYFVDLPGFGYAKVSQKQRASWQRLIGQYVTEREELRVIFQLIDSRHEPTKLDEELIEIMRGSPVPRVILLTKADKLGMNQQRSRVAQLQKRLAATGIELPVVLTSAEKKTGMDEVWKWVETLL
jgi:GTP-binding protein